MCCRRSVVRMMAAQELEKHLDLLMWKGRGYKPASLHPAPEQDIVARSYFRPGEEETAGARLLACFLPCKGKRCLWTTMRSLEMARSLAADLAQDPSIPGHMLVILPPPSKVSESVRALNARRNFFPRVEVLDRDDLLLPETLKRLPRRSWPRRVQPEAVLRDLGLEHRGELPLLRPDDLAVVVAGAVSGDVVAQKDGVVWTARLVVAPVPVTAVAKRIQEVTTRADEERLQGEAHEELRRLLLLKPATSWVAKLLEVLHAPLAATRRRLELREHVAPLLQDSRRLDILSAGLASLFVGFPHSCTKSEETKIQVLLTELQAAVKGRKRPLSEEEQLLRDLEDALQQDV